jgi:hypothetical protein
VTVKKKGDLLIVENKFIFRLILVVWFFKLLNFYLIGCGKCRDPVTLNRRQDLCCALVQVLGVLLHFVPWTLCHT